MSRLATKRYSHKDALMDWRRSQHRTLAQAFTIFIISILILNNKQEIGTFTIIWFVIIGIVICAALMAFDRFFLDLFVAVTFMFLSVNVRGMDPADALIVILLISGILSKRLRFRGGPSLPPILNIFATLFLIGYSISNLLGSPVITQLLQFIINSLFVFFLWSYVRSASSVRVIILSLFIGAIGAEAIALAAQQGWITLSPVFFEISRGQRVMGLMGDPNMVGLIALFIALWLLDELVEPKLWRGNFPAKLLALSFLLGTMILSLSRSAWIGMATGTITFALLYHKRQAPGRRLKLAVYSIISICVAIFFLFRLLGYKTEVYQRAAETFSPLSNEEIDRFQLLYTKQALSLVPGNFFGVGTGRTEEIFADQYGHSLGAHNTYVQVLADNGWLTFCGALLILIYIAAITLKRNASIPIARTGISIVTIAAWLTGLATMALFHDLLYWKIPWVILGISSIVLWPFSKKNRRLELHT